MREGLFITGTDTDVGKTVVASIVASAIRRRLAARATAGEDGLTHEPKVALWKPVQTGVKSNSPESDSARLVLGSGLPQEESETATYTFPDPVAPWMAAQRAGSRISFQSLVNEGWDRLRVNDYTVVEGAGGLAVPLTDRQTVRDLAASLGLPLIIVARPGLGTVNHTLQTVAYARSAGIEVRGVILNGYREGQTSAMYENAVMIEHFGDVPVIGKLPWVPASPVTEADWSLWRERWAELADGHIDLNRLL